MESSETLDEPHSLAVEFNTTANNTVGWSPAILLTRLGITSTHELYPRFLEFFSNQRSSLPQLYAVLCAALHQPLPESSEDQISVEALRQQLQDVQAEKVMLEVTSEQQSHQYERQHVELAAEVEEWKQKAARYKKELDSTESSSDTLRAEYRSIKVQLESYQSEVTSLRGTLLVMEKDKQESVSTLLKKEADIDRLTAEQEDLMGRLNSTKNELSRAEATIFELQSTERTFKFQVAKLEQEIALSKQQNEWLSKDLQARSEELNSFRSEKTSVTMRLQTELDSTQASLEAAEKSCSFLKQQLALLESSSEKLNSQLRDTQAEAISVQDGLKQELTIQKKLNDLLRKSDQDKSARLEEMRKSLDELDRQLEMRQSELHDELQSKDQELVRLRTKLQLLEESYARVEGQQDRSASPGRSALLNRAGRTGKTVTEMYSDMANQEVEVEKLRSENAQLRMGMQEILDEVQTRSKHYDELEVAYDQLVKEANELSLQLDAAYRERESAVRQLQTMKSDLKQLQDDEKWFRQKNADLSSQLQVLLVVVEEEQGHLPPGTLSEVQRLTATAPNLTQEGDGVQSVISDGLVAFRNIQELQDKNEHLLQVVRKLSDEKENEELERQQAELHDIREKYKNASSQLQALVDERKQSEILMKSIINERDMYRRMANENGRMGRETPATRKTSSGLTPGSSPDLRTDSPDRSTNVEAEHYKKLAAEVQAAFDALKSETAEDNKTLQEQLKSAQKDASENRLTVAHLNSEKEFLQTRIQNLTLVEEHQKRELSELRDRLAKVMSNVAVFEARLKHSEEARVQATAQLDDIKYQMAHLKAEKELFEKSEARWQEERQHLVDERNRLNELIRCLQTMHGELERNESENKTQLRKEKELIESELSALRNRLAEDASDLNALSMRKDAEIKEWQVKYERLNEDNSHNREELAVLSAKMESLQDKISSLHDTITQKEEEIRQLRIRSSTIAAATTRRLKQIQFQPISDHLPPTPEVVISGEIDIAMEAEQAENEIRVRERQLETELRQLRVQYAESQAEIERHRKHTETYQEISKAAEEKLNSLNEAYSEYKLSTDERIQQLSIENTDLRAQLQTVQFNLGAEYEQLKISEAASLSKIENLEMQLDGAVNELDSLRKSETEARSGFDFMRKEMLKLKNAVEESNSNYEQEMLKHARTVEQLQLSKEKVQRLQNDKNSLSQKLELVSKKLNEGEGHWLEQKELLEKERHSLNRRFEDVQNQNNLLHSQIETLNAQIVRIQHPLTELGSAAEEQANALSQSIRSTENLQEVIKYLRREREILDFEKESLAQENRRLEQQIESCNRQLEENRTMLISERHKRENGHFISEGEYAELQGKVNQLDILRESNSTLRSENNQNRSRAMKAELKVKELQAQLDPLMEQLRSLQAELEARVAEIATLEEDNSRWKARTQQILAKYDKIDPEEHRLLEENYNKLKEETTARLFDLSQSLEEKENALHATEEKANRAQHIADQWKLKFEKNELCLKSANDKLKSLEEYNDIKSQNENFATEIQELKRQADALNARLVTLETQKKESAERYKKLQLAAKNWRQKVLEMEKEAVEKSDESQTQNANELQAKVLELESKHATDMANARQEVEIKYKLKMSMFEKKVQKLEADNRSLLDNVKSLSSEIELNAKQTAPGAKRARESLGAAVSPMSAEPTECGTKVLSSVSSPVNKKIRTGFVSPQLASPNKTMKPEALEPSPRQATDEQVIVHAPMAVAEEPSNSMAVDEESSMAVIEEPSLVVVEEPTLAVIEEPSLAVVEEPSLAVVEEPSMAVIEEPSMTVVEVPLSTVVEESHATPDVIEPEPVVEEQGESQDEYMDYPETTSPTVEVIDTNDKEMERTEDPIPEDTVPTEHYETDQHIQSDTLIIEEEEEEEPEDEIEEEDDHHGDPSYELGMEEGEEDSETESTPQEVAAAPEETAISVEPSDHGEAQEEEEGEYSADIEAEAEEPHPISAIATPEPPLSANASEDVIVTSKGNVIQKITFDDPAPPPKKPVVVRPSSSTPATVPKAKAKQPIRTPTESPAGRGRNVRATPDVAEGIARGAAAILRGVGLRGRRARGRGRGTS